MPETATQRTDLIKQLSDMTLPMMWILRQDAVRAFEPMGIRPFKALLIELIAKGMQHPKDLAEVMDTLPPTISTMLAELEQEDLVSRQIDSSDRRRIKLSLTAKGEALHKDMQGRWLELGSDRFKHLSTKEMETLYSLFSKLLENREDS